MKAITKYQYGGPEVLQMENVLVPQPDAHEILLKVSANSANPADWHIMRGAPFLARLSFGLFKPKNHILGSDVAGTVEAVGTEVKDFKPGDLVFGELLEGAFAEYALAKPQQIAKFEQGPSFEEMAALPIAGLTAWQALHEHGKIKKGERVIINGASGGVGHFAIQMAKAAGAEVSAICSSQNVDFVQELGADKVIAYDLVDLQQIEDQHDLVIDVHGNLHFSDLKQLGKRAVLVGFVGMRHMMGVLLGGLFSKYKIAQFTAAVRSEDLSSLVELLQEGHLKPHIEQVYRAEEIPKAIAHIEKMRTRGKVVMAWD